MSNYKATYNKKKSTNIFPFKIKKLWINKEFVVSFRWNNKTIKADIPLIDSKNLIFCISIY